jgi:hypothetical protein
MEYRKVNDRVRKITPEKGRRRKKQNECVKFFIFPLCEQMNGTLWL